MQAIIGILIVVVVALGGWWLLTRDEVPTRSPTATSTNATSQQTFSSTNYGLAFAYSSAYELEERDMEGSAQRRHHVITLMRTEDLPPPQGGEGSPSITIDIIQNDLDDHTTEEWIRNSSVSNFKLSPDNRLASTTIAGEAALTYLWDGLYRGETVAIARPKYVYAFSVTSLETSDPIRVDFQHLLDTVSFQ